MALGLETEAPLLVPDDRKLSSSQSQRVLIEMSGRWETHEPMTGEDFQPLVGQAHVGPDKPPPAPPEPGVRP